MDSQIVYTDELGTWLAAFATETGADRVFLLTDSNVETAVLPRLEEFISRCGVEVIAMPAGECHKNLETLSTVWHRLSECGATRRSLLVALGGGVVTDLGGFAAATFKRGIRHVNVPTTLLGQVDAAIGGKTGIDFAGLKNEIGAFAPAAAVVISGAVLSTLPDREWLCGVAEMVKTALISSDNEFREVCEAMARGDRAAIAALAAKMASHKEAIVALDPKEKGLRKVLNFGHTYAHALESAAAARGADLPHGYAVAYGIDYALQMSERECGLDPEVRETYRRDLLSCYPPLGELLRIKNMEEIEKELVDYMGHDKKNETFGKPRFILLESPGNPVY